MILFIKHIENEGPENLGVFFKAQGFKWLAVDLHEDGCLPDDPRGLDAIISLGGPMNVYEEDRYHFLHDEDVFLKKALGENIPILGICLGAQLLAKAGGGKVVRSPQKEIGWYDIDLTTSASRDLLFDGFPAKLEVFQWHGDMCQPSEGAEILASSPACPIQAFRQSRKAYGLQFHAEITDMSIRAWGQDLPGPEREKMIEHYRQVRPVFEGHGQLLCQNFLKIMKEPL